MANKPCLKPWHYAVGATSLIPLVGLPSALFSVALGVRWIRQGGMAIVLLGLAGLAGSAWTAQALFHPLGPSKHAEEAQKALNARQELRALAEKIEAYRAQNGKLPDNLEVAAAGLPVKDLAGNQPVPGDPLPYFYETLPDGQSYYWLSRGPDGSSFTPDDLYPVLTEDEKSHWGFRKPPEGRNTLLDAKGSSAAVSISWRDPEPGLAEAKKTGKPVLLDFTAEWCGWCHKLERDVFDQPEVTLFINQHYIPVRVMDQRRETGSNTHIVADLQSKFGVGGFPMLVVADGDLKRSSVQNGYVPYDGTFAFLKAFVKP